MKRPISRRKIGTSQRRYSDTLIQIGEYIFPISDIARIGDRVKELYHNDTGQQIGWTFAIALKNGDILLWQLNEEDYNEQEALMSYYVQSREYAESLRIATMQLMWGSDARVVRPEDIVYDQSV